MGESEGAGVCLGVARRGGSWFSLSLSLFVSSVRLVRWRAAVVNAQDAAARTIRHLDSSPPASYSAALHSLSSFAELLREDVGIEGLSTRDVEVLVRWLERDEGVLVSDSAVGGSPQLLTASPPSLLRWSIALTPFHRAICIWICT